ncbi:hypothetical protein GVAV_000664 [Gurleya vavrai]
MNPFQLNFNNDNHLFSILSKLSKKSLTTKLKALEELKTNLDCFNLKQNANEIIDSLKPILQLQDYEIKNACIEILIFMYDRIDDKNLFESVIPFIIFYFMEYPNNENVKFFIKKIDIKRYGDDLYNLINIKKNFILFYKTIILLNKIKYDQIKIKEKIMQNQNNFLFDDVLHLKYIKIILDFICEDLNEIEEFYLIKKKIKNFNCITLKWQILQNNFNFFEKEMFYEDSKNIEDYLMIEILKRNLGKIDFNEFKIRNKNILQNVLLIAENKVEIIQKYLNENELGSKNLNFNLFNYFCDFEYINKNFDFNKINQMLEFTINQNTENLKLKNLSNDLVLSFLTDKEKTLRCYVLKRKLDVNVKLEDILDILEKALEVLPKEFFVFNLNNIIENEHFIYKKYPGLLNFNYLNKNCKKKEKLVNILGCIQDKNLIKKIENLMRINLKCNDFIFIYEKCEKIPDGFNEIFYFNLNKKIKIDKKLNVRKMLKYYFSEKIFIDALDTNICINDFLKEVHRFIKKIKVKNCNLFDDEFYYYNKYFYQNFSDTPMDNKNYLKLKTILNILESFYKKNKKSEVLFLIYLIKEITKQKYEINFNIKINKMIKKNIKKSNLYFCFKILHDLKTVGILKEDKFDKLYFKSVNENFKLEIIEFEKNKFEEIINKYNYLLKEHTEFSCNEFNKNKFGLNEDFLSYATIFYVSRNKEILNKFLPSILKIKNLRIKNLIANKLNLIEKRIDFIFQNNFINSSLSLLSVKESLIFNLDNLNFITNEGIKNIFLRIDNMKENFDEIIQIIEKDNIWSDKSCFYPDRITLYNQLLKPIYIYLSESIINNYNLTRFEAEAIDKEIFILLVENISFFEKQNTKSSFFVWNVFLNSINLIRNLNILFFLENNIKDYKINLNEENKKLLAYNFPSLCFEEININEFIIEESKHKIDGINSTLNKTTNGFLLKANYSFEETKFELKIEIDEKKVKNTKFYTNLYQKDLLTIKTSNLLKKSRKFMEILSLWKVNVDFKIQGTKECLICYYIVDMVDKSFPDFKCRECKNGFHKKCISKWIEKHKKNECPLCRRNVA